jgi:hypothetical protein
VGGQGWSISLEDSVVEVDWTEVEEKAAGTGLREGLVVLV